jgi:hypothetical protein
MARLRWYMVIGLVAFWLGLLWFAIKAQGQPMTTLQLPGWWVIQRPDRPEPIFDVRIKEEGGKIVAGYYGVVGGTLFRTTEWSKTDKGWREEHQDGMVLLWHQTGKRTLETEGWRMIKTSSP